MSSIRASFVGSARVSAVLGLDDDLLWRAPARELGGSFEHVRPRMGLHAADEPEPAKQMEEAGGAFSRVWISNRIAPSFPWARSLTCPSWAWPRGESLLASVL